MASKKPSDKSKADPFAGFDDVLSKKDGSASGKGKGKASAGGSASTPAKESAATPSSDPVTDLESVAKSSRPQTPASKKPGTGTGTPAKKSLEEPRASAETTTTAMGGEETATTTATAPTTAKEEASAESTGGGGWWGGFGGLMGAASAAVKQAQSQAELIAKELQKNEEAQKWAEHVKGNAALLRSYGGDLRQITGELRSRALPGLTNLLHTLAPPISSHERLQVHVTHDMAGYPSMNPLVHAVFTRVMAQVEGGDLVVLKRGAGASADDSAASDPTSYDSSAGWSDGPWWRDMSTPRDVGAVPGLVEGSKLARASAEAFASEWFARHGGLDAARTAASEATLSDSNPTRSSDIFLAVQALTRPKPTELFAASSSESTDTKESKDPKASADEKDAADDSELLFAIYLHDPLHALSASALTQAVPARWVTGWLDLPAAVLAARAAAPEGEVSSAYLPPDIADLILAGGLDPREWAAEWVEEALALAVGVVAQRYVARRMGVGERGAEGLMGAKTGQAEEAGAGELARAM